VTFRSRFKVLRVYSATAGFYQRFNDRKLLLTASGNRNGKPDVESQSKKKKVGPEIESDGLSLGAIETCRPPMMLLNEDDYLQASCNVYIKSEQVLEVGASVLTKQACISCSLSKFGCSTVHKTTPKIGFLSFLLTTLTTHLFFAFLGAA